MEILTAEEMGAADRRSVEAGVAVSALMEAAGAAVARFVLRRYAVDGSAGSSIVVLCGKGNNGGDGLVAARHLEAAGMWVRVALLGARSEVKGDAAAALEKVFEVREITDEAGLKAALEGAALVVDAVLGTGFKPPMRGLAVTARELLEEMSCPVVAVDLPSGWDADSMEEKAEGAFRADAVVTFAAPKLAHVFGHLTPGKTFGPVVVAGIGTPEDAIVSSTGLTWCGASKEIAEKPRAINGNKGRLGHVLIVGGAWGKAGAPSMASVAAMRTGAGLVTAAVPERILPIVAAVAPELMLQGLEVQDSGLALEQLEFIAGTTADSSATLRNDKQEMLRNDKQETLRNDKQETLRNEKQNGLLKGITVVGIGPGLGQEGSTPEFVRKFVEHVTLPMVIDADALNAIAERSGWLKQVAKGRTLVLTPHPGEMARLVGMSVKEVEADRVGLARRFATEHGVTLVLKGWRTLVAHPDGRVAVNTTGNPSMAKGGSGDILTGIVSAMLAQYPHDVARAVEAAVFLHGLAGDFACLAQDEHTVLAMDTVGHLWEAFRARVKDEDGLTWVSGTAKNRQ
jgi:NAD(P)H-hydrate epimerase